MEKRAFFESTYVDGQEVLRFGRVYFPIGLAVFLFLVILLGLVGMLVSGFGTGNPWLFVPPIVILGAALLSGLGYVVWATVIEFIHVNRKDLQ